MAVESVVDTNVLVAISIELDMHHENCLEYVRDTDCCHVPPVVSHEFAKVESKLRTTLFEDLAEHRLQVEREIESGHITPGKIQEIRRRAIDEDWRSHNHIHAFYDQLEMSAGYDPIYKIELVDQLEMLENEVWQDAAIEHGGLSELVDYWNGSMSRDPTVRSKLLVHEGDDVDVCLEAHYIAKKTPDCTTELGTANPRHFVYQVSGEPESREDNICRVTAIDSIENLSA